MSRTIRHTLTRHLPAVAGMLTLSWSAVAFTGDPRQGPFPIDIAEARAAADAAFDALDTDGDGVVSRSEFMDAPMRHRAGPHHGKGRHLYRMRDRADAESRDAARGAWRERRAAYDDAVFERLDTDGDGVLSPEEFGSREIREARSEITRERMFERLDQSGSGTLSREEFTGWWVGRLEAMDADGDGVVTREEAKAYRRAPRGGADQ